MGERAIMEAIRYEPEPIPGLPSVAQCGTFTYLSPEWFIVEDVAYARYSAPPIVWCGGDTLGDQWGEVLSSVWGDVYAAHQAAQSQ